jgi:hypothetical protein
MSPVTPLQRAWIDARRVASAASVLALVLALAACPGLSDPASPDTSLTGTNPNATATFSGVITLNGGGGAVPADGTSDFLVQAVITDNTGAPVANGVVVNFATSLGSVRASGSDPATAGSSTPVSTFEGKAVVALRSTAAGVANVTAWIADVARTVTVRFDHAAVNGTVDVVFREAGTDVPTITTTAPADALVVARALDELGAALGGMTIRFKIERDTTGGAGVGGAYWGAPPKTPTNSSGEAYNTLFVKGVGEVVAFARLHDPLTDELIASSGAITLITTQIQAEASMTLEFDDGSTTTAGTVGLPSGINAVVTSERTGQVLVGIPVKFSIIGDSTDTTAFDRAELAANGDTFTDSVGQAINAVIAYDSGAVVVIEAVARDPATREVIARSNQIVYSVS